MKEIIDEMNRARADSWVIYDFGANNPVFGAIVGNYHLTRKCFVIIRRDGEKSIICHSIDSGVIRQKGVPEGFKLVQYSRWTEMIDLLKAYLEKDKTIMMEISENGLMPRVSYVDYGTAMLIKSFGCELISSANIFQLVSSRMSPESYNLHMKASRTVTNIKDQAFEFLFRSIKEKGEVSEYVVQQFIMDRFAENNMVTDSPPIVAIAKNAANPHYEPSEDSTDYIRPRDIVLMDLWAKYDLENAVFGDITWMGYVGEEIPARYQAIYDIVKTASDAAIQFVIDTLPKRAVYGYEVDDVSRKVIEDSGYGQYFTHRTGHSLSVGESDHGTGANIDNFETHDTRELVNGVGFSIEPGIYIEGEIGVREECNVCIWNNEVVVTTPRQTHILTPKDYGISF